MDTKYILIFCTLATKLVLQSITTSKMYNNAQDEKRCQYLLWDKNKPRFLLFILRHFHVLMAGQESTWFLLRLCLNRFDYCKINALWWLCGSFSFNLNKNHRKSKKNLFDEFPYRVSIHITLSMKHQLNLRTIYL